MLAGAAGCTGQDVVIGHTQAHPLRTRATCIGAQRPRLTGVARLPLSIDVLDGQANKSKREDLVQLRDANASLGYGVRPRGATGGRACVCILTNAVPGVRAVPVPVDCPCACACARADLPVPACVCLSAPVPVSVCATLQLPETVW